MEHYKNLSLENIETEEWKDVVGFEQFYQVSSFGRIKSKETERFYVADRSKVSKKLRRKFYPVKIFKQRSVKGYHVVSIDRRPRLVHRLVAFAFIPNPENKPFVNHKNGIRNDNKTVNLEWVTKKENEQHAWRVLGRKAVVGESNGKSKFTVSDIKEIRRDYEITHQITRIAKLFNTTKSYILSIVHRKVWKHVV